MALLSFLVGAAAFSGVGADSGAFLSDAAARNLQLSCWTSRIANLFMDVDVSCGFPPDEKVHEQIREREAKIVKISSETLITPEMDELDIDVLRDGAQASDLADKSVSDLLEPHEDTCAGVMPAQTGEAVYNNIKAYVDTFDIYTKCTKVYVPNTENGKPKMQKDDIIAIVTEPFPGHFTLSYEDVAQYQDMSIVKVLKL